MKNKLIHALAIALMLNTTLIGVSSAQKIGAEITDAHSCEVRVVDPSDRTQSQMVSGTCGMVADPDSGKMEPYRTFVNPYTGQIHEQYCQTPKTVWNKDKTKSKQVCKTEQEGGKIRDIVRVLNKPTPKVDSPAAAPVVAYERADLNQPSKTESNASKYLVIGGTIVAIVGVAVGVRYSMRPRAIKEPVRGKVEERKTTTTAPKRLGGGRVVTTNPQPKALHNMPKSVTLGKDVPKGAGKKVAVAGAVPSNSVPANIPRFETSTGQTYIIQSNPNTNLLETILLYDFLTRPYYYSPLSYGSYDGGFAYSPYEIGAHDAIVENQDYSRSEFNQDSYGDRATDTTYAFANDSNSTVVSDSIISGDTAAPSGGGIDLGGGGGGGGGGGIDFGGGGGGGGDFGGGGGGGGDFGGGGGGGGGGDW